MEPIHEDNKPEPIVQKPTAEVEQKKPEVIQAEGKPSTYQSVGVGRPAKYQSVGVGRASKYQSVGVGKPQKYESMAYANKSHENQSDEPPQKVNISTHRSLADLGLSTHLKHEIISPDKYKPQKDALVSGMNLLGQSVTTYTNPLAGSIKTQRLLLTGTVDQWSKLLSDVNSHSDFDTYVTPFLAEVGGHTHTIERSSGYGRGGQIIGHNYKRYGKVSDKDILNFLMALYGYDANTKKASTLDLPNGLMEGGSNTELVNKYSQALSKFIKLYQHRLVNHLSERGEFIESSDAKKLAKEATYYGEKQTGNNNDLKAIKAMVQSSICTAYVGAARVFNAKIAHNFADVNKEEAIGINMIRNSGYIIGGALDQYGTIITNLEAGITNTLGAAWGLVSIPKPLAALINVYKTDSFTIIAKKFKIGGSNKDISQYKRNIVDAFASCIFETFEQKDLGKYQELVSKRYNVKLAVNEVTGEWYGNLVTNFSDALGTK